MQGTDRSGEGRRGKPALRGDPGSGLGLLTLAGEGREREKNGEDNMWKERRKENLQHDGELSKSISHEQAQHSQGKPNTPRIDISCPDHVQTMYTSSTYHSRFMI